LQQEQDMRKWAEETCKKQNVEMLDEFKLLEIKGKVM
jgi:hypothetical protein